MFRNRLPSIFSQSGFAPVILLVLVMFGIAAGTILVQNGVNFIPKAADEQEALKPVDPKKLKECDDKENPEDVQKCKDQVCSDDEVTYCDNRGDSPKAIRKTGGYYDPQHPLHDGSGCVFDFFEVSEKNDQCSKSESKSGDVVYTTKGEGDQIDSGRKNSQKDREKAAKCASKVECRKNGDKLEAWRIISTFDEETNKCIGAKIENGRLVSDNSRESFEFPDGSRDKECKSDKQVIEQSNSDGPKDGKDLASSSDRGRFGIDTDNQTKTLLSNFESTRARIQSNTVLNAEQKKKLLEKIDKADKALQNAKSYIDKCIQTGTQADCSAALSAQIYAVALSREALAEVVEAGIEGTKENPIRVKTDLQIGQNNNSQVTAKPANGVPGFGRVFARAEGGKIYFEVRGDDGKFYLADPADLKSAGLTQGMSLEDYQKWMSGRLKAVRETTKTEPVLQPSTKKANGEPCSSNTDCQSNSCPAPATSGTQRTCQPSTTAPAPAVRINGSGVQGVPSPDDVAKSSSNGVAINRTTSLDKCLNSCSEYDPSDVQCIELIPSYPADKDLEYGCDTIFRADFLYQIPHATIYKVSNEYCKNVCGTQQKCILLYSAAIPALKHKGAYSYTCATNTTPEGYVTPADNSVEEGYICTDQKQCKSGLTCGPSSIPNIKGCYPPRTAPAAGQYTLSDLTVKETDPANKTTCEEGITCKFFLPQAKSGGVNNDGLIIYLGRTDSDFTLISPKGVVGSVKLTKPSNFTNANELNNFLSSQKEKLNSLWSQYNSNGGKVKQP